MVRQLKIVESDKERLQKLQNDCGCYLYHTWTSISPATLIGSLMYVHRMVVDLFMGVLRMNCFVLFLQDNERFSVTLCKALQFTSSLMVMGCTECNKPTFSTA